MQKLIGVCLLAFIALIQGKFFLGQRLEKKYAENK
jgi:hypothetical protein